MRHILPFLSCAPCRTKWDEKTPIRLKYLPTLEVTNEDIITRINQGEMHKCMDCFCEMIISSTNTSVSSELLYFGIMRSTRQERCRKKVFMWKGATSWCGTGYDFPENGSFKVKIELYWTNGQILVMNLRGQVGVELTRNGSHSSGTCNLVEFIFEHVAEAQ